MHQFVLPTFVLDSDGRVVVWNKACELLTGIPAAALLGTCGHWRAFHAVERPCLADLMVHGRLDEIDQYYPVFRRADTLADGVHAETWCAMPGRGMRLYLEIDAGPVWDADGRLVAVVQTLRDISDRKREEAERIDHLEHHDALTGLYNRHNLEHRLAQSLLAARREKRVLALLLIDLDRFKIINDTLGHHVGDLLLVEVARRLRACVRECDMVARLGGDEFVVAPTGLADAADAAQVAAKILDALGAPYAIADKTLYSTPSIGISVFPANGEDSDTLMKHADAAMYHAKEKGRNNFQFFSPAMTAAAAERMELERDLRWALAAGQYELHWQPQVSARSGRVLGAEGLIRWQHPERGLIPPLKFIPIAEETGAIEAIGAWVVDEACRQKAQWRRQGLADLRISVNLSAQQLRSPALVQVVREAMSMHGLGPGELELEITETTVMENPELAVIQLKALRGLGVGLAIDDFGTGYSSLAYLKMLPIDTLKLDRAFVHDIERNENDAAISAATLALARNLGLTVVAEGVESEAQRRFLVEHGCDLLQGYLFGRPQPAAFWSERWGAPGAD